MIIDHKKKVLDDTVLWLEIGVKYYLASLGRTQRSGQMAATRRTVRHYVPHQNKDFFSTNFLATHCLANLRHYDLVLLKPRPFLKCRPFRAWSNASEALGYPPPVLRHAITVSNATVS